MATNPTIKVKAEYYALWEDHTWDDGHFHEVTVESGDDAYPADSDIQQALNDHVEELMKLTQYRKAVLLVPVSHEVIDDGQET